MKTSEEKYQVIVNKIEAAFIKQQRLLIIKNLLLFLVLTAVSLLLAEILESIFHFSSAGRIVFDSLFVLALLVLFVLKILFPLFSIFSSIKFSSLIEMAKQIGKQFPSLADKLANSIQVYGLKKENPHGYSKNLIDQSINTIYRKTDKLNFNQTVTVKPVLKAIRLFGVVIVFFATINFLWFQQLAPAANRLMNPFVSFEKPDPIRISIIPGNKQVLKNESVEIKAEVFGKKINELSLHLVEVANDFQLTHRLPAKNENQFQFVIEHIQDTTEYYFSTEKFISDKYKLNVIDLPMIRHLQIKLVSPKYSGLDTQLLEENIGDLHCLKGSFANISIQTNKQLIEAVVGYNEDKRIPLDVSANSAIGGFKINEAGSYRIRLLDSEGFKNLDPIEYRISIIEDIFPNIYITTPGQDIDLTEDLILPLTLEAEDDFGFSALGIWYKIIKADNPLADTSLKFLPLNSNLAKSERIIINYDWDLTTLDLFAGDLVQYYAEIYDNDDVSGPKASRSKTYLARFPTLEEIFAEVSTEQEQTYESFEGLFEKSKDLKEHIKEIVEEMKQNPEMKWEEKKQVEDVIQNQRQLEKSLREVQQQLEQMVERMEQNDLLSMETLEKYSELQKMLDEIMSEELKEAIKKLQQAVEQIDEEKLKKAMEQLEFSQEEFLKNIEKTLNILKRLQVEQKLDELAKKIEKLLQEQKEINEQLKNKPSQNELSSVCKDQEKTKQKTEDFLSETESLKNEMDELPNSPQDQIEQILGEAARQELLKNMGQVCSNTKTGQTNSACKSGSKAESTLAEMMEMMNAAKQEMIERHKQEVMAELQRLSRNFLTLSHKQEKLLNNSKKLSRNSPRLTQHVDQQQDLLNAMTRNANKMGELTQKTFFVSSQMARSVGQAMKSMNQALAKFEERNIAQSAKSQQQAMVYLNEAVKQLMTAMKDLSKSQSGTGMEEMMEKLAQMAGKQQGINQQTMQLGMGQPSMSLAQQAAMARLAAEQNALRKAMQQMQNEFGESSELLGRLDQMGKDMEDVVKDLQTRKVSRKTINRQQRILQRLLDAQKSARKQDYSRKRKAETGKYYPSINPGKLPADLGEKENKMRRDLIRALKEGYSKDYQELIKKYFDTLMKETIENEKKN